MNLVAYTRVSTGEQVHNGNGLSTQAEAIGRWAASHNHTIVQWCTDEGITGKVFDRPGLLECLALIEGDGSIEGVVAHAETRYGRTIEVQEAFFAKVWAAGGRVFSVEVGEVLEDDVDDPMRTAMRQFRGIMSQLEAGMIRKRLREGKRAKIRRGDYAGGPIPFGWRVVGDQFLPLKYEQDVLEEMWRMMDGGMTNYEVAATLNRKGIPTRSGARWRPTSISRQLRPGQHPTSRSSVLTTSER